MDQDTTHLLRRAGFGATAAEATAAAAQGYGATVDRLLAGLAQDDPGADAVAAPELGSPLTYRLALRAARRSGDKGGAASVQRQLRADNEALVGWWLARMVATTNPLREKLTFLLHGHFPTAVSKVRFASYMYGQNQLFRTQGPGGFDALTQAVATDPAMLIWLDAASDKAADPNENFARELMERFTMGIGTYTEADVRAAAYCFTGWRLDLRSGGFTIDQAQHSPVTQMVLGSPVNTGAQVIDLVTHSAASARYVPAAFWSHLAYPVGPSDPVVTELSSAYGSDLNMTALLRAIFEHPRFTSTTAMGGLIKQPTEYVVGALRALGAVGVLGAALGPRAWEVVFGGATDSRGALGAPSGRRLVLVTLYGGNDGLNTLIPYQDPQYAASRGALAVEADKVLPLSEGFGLHPSLVGLKKLWDAKRLAIVQGVGFPDPNYSHFESMDIWQSGSTSSVATGWIGRWLDRNGSSPLRAVGIGPTVPIVLQGENVQGASIPAGPIRLPGSVEEQSLFAQLSGTTRSEATLLMEAARSNANLLTVDRRLGPTLASSATSDPLHLRSASGSSADSTAQGALAIANGGGGLSSPQVLATQLSIVANLILAGSPTEVYSVELGGFDTHADQAPTQQTLLTEVDTAVSAFVDALDGQARGQGTVVVVYTEFGRRIVGNASGGTDHGWANVVFAAGPGVRGGWYGEPPSLDRVSDGNLIFTTDFRSVYATVLAEVLGADPSDFLSGSFRGVPFV